MTTLREQKLAIILQSKHEVAQSLLVPLLENVTYIINATPTGEQRNKFCDAQIHIMAARDLLR